MDMQSIAVLEQLNNGNSIQELTDALRNVTAAVKLTQKKGSVTLKIDIEPASNGNGEIVFIGDSITCKIPEFSRAKKIFFVDDNNDLVREDPRQRKFPEIEERQ